MSTRYAAKRDTAEAPIVARLRAHGAEVTPIDGRDVPDLLVSYRGSWGVAEVKTGKAALRPGQIAWAARQKAPVPVLRTPEDAEAWLRAWPPTESDIVNAWQDAHDHGTGVFGEVSRSTTAGKLPDQPA